MFKHYSKILEYDVTGPYSTLINLHEQYLDFNRPRNIIVLPIYTLDVSFSVFNRVYLPALRIELLIHTIFCRQASLPIVGNYIKKVVMMSESSKHQ